MAENREPLSLAKRKRLQQFFEHATKAADQGNFEYAIKMLAECVIGDPNNAIYARQLLSTLSRQYNNSAKNVSKLAGIKAAGAKGSIKKASMQKDWPSMIKAGIEVLKANPWDVGALTAMAQACDALEAAESQLCYLKMALDVNSKDVDVNRLCARALARVRQYDQAIACWHRVEQAKPGDEEAQRAIGDLSVEKTISVGGYEEAESSNEVKRNKDSRDDDDLVRLTPEQQLVKKIGKNPSELSLYTELADMHIRNERMEEAEQVLAQALEVSGGGDVSLRERLEDVQLRRSRNEVSAAEKRAEAEKTDEARAQAKAKKEELNQVEIKIYRSRSDRYPTNMSLKYELGVRLKRAGQFSEAIQHLQQARADTKRRGQTLIELGECFQALKQYPLAISNFEGALEHISEREFELRKMALYRSGRLALALSLQDTSGASNGKWLDAAEKHLTDLAGIDFVYKDVPALLDKIAKLRDKG